MLGCWSIQTPQLSWCSINALPWYNHTPYWLTWHKTPSYLLLHQCTESLWRVAQSIISILSSNFSCWFKNKIFTSPPPFFVSFSALTHHSSSTSFRITMISPSLNVSSSSLSASQSYRALQRRRLFCYTQKEVSMRWGLMVICPQHPQYATLTTSHCGGD